VQLVTISSYITEITPKTSRGEYIALSQVISYCAVPCVAAISLLAIPHSWFGIAGLRYVALAGGAGALVVWFLRARLPESPRWLAAHGRYADALNLISKMESEAIRETGRKLPEPEPAAAETADLRGAWIEIWKQPYLGRTVMLTVFNAFQAIGYYGFAAWVPVLLVNEGIETTRSLLYVLLMAGLNPIGSAIAMRYADTFQRKWQIVILALTIAGCGLIWAQQRTALGIVLLGAVITLANSWFSCALHTYQAELYPTRIRAQAVGFVYSWSRFTSIFVGFLIAQVLHSYGTLGVFGIIASAMLIVAIVVGTFGPRSNRIQLEILSG